MKTVNGQTGFLTEEVIISEIHFFNRSVPKRSFSEQIFLKNSEREKLENLTPLLER